jgi:hypothetical protein
VLAALVALGFAIWLATPALSLGPYRPEPVDFELRDQPAPLTTQSAEPARSAALDREHGSRPVLASRVLRTSKRFNVVGLRWKGARAARLTLRVRQAGGGWSPWIEVPVDPDHGPDRGTRESRHSGPASDPVWAGEADAVQYRIAASEPVRGVRLHFVNSTGTATKLDRVRARLHRALNAATAKIGSVFGADARAQGSSQPAIVSRAEWGASACPPRAKPAIGQVRLAFIHHTVTANDYSPDQSAAMVLGICRYHRNSNGWNDIGYEFLVDKYGKIFEGRAGGIDRAVIGAQAQGYNSLSTGISSLGTFSTTGQTEEGLAALAHLLSWKLALHGVAPQSSVTVRSGGGSLNRYPAGANVTFNAIAGHRDADKTACPGDGLYGQLPRLRGMVSGDTRPPTSISLAADHRNIPYGRKARLTGMLKSADGAPLPLGPIQIQAVGGSLSPLGRATTGVSGEFSTNVRLVFNRTVQAQFSGNAGLRPALSAPLALGVRPRVTAHLRSGSDGRVDTRQRVVLTGSVRPRKRYVLLLIDRRRSDGSYRRISKAAVRTRLGRVRATTRLARAGGYRLRLGVDRDARNLSARSAGIEVDAVRASASRR